MPDIGISLAGQVAAIEDWNAVAVESNNAVEEYLRSVYPDLPEHYGMPVDGVRMVVEYFKAPDAVREKEQGR